MSIIPNSVFGGRYDTSYWDPFEDFHFKCTVAMPHAAFPNEATSFVSARIDCKETPEAYVFKADLPGLKKDEVKVEVENGKDLCISGNRKVEKEVKTDMWHRVERSSGEFFRRFRLPENAKANKATTSLENGVLTVTVPKEETKKHSFRTIDISGS
jgi:HSP20 family protein|uniref:SHSP domain-containing protein n=1 Tax=Fagus sylvatica TaxID=28930 RepID=A0A2N9H8H4_FAGSY